VCSSDLQLTKSIAEAKNDYTFISEDEITVSGVPAMKLVFSYYLSNSGSPVQMMICNLVKGQTIWMITFQCVPACWSTYEGTFNTVLDSFQAL
jgi:hypothetical protein